MGPLLSGAVKAAMKEAKEKDENELIASHKAFTRTSTTRARE